MDQDQASAAAAAYFGSIYPVGVWAVNRRVRQDGEQGKKLKRRKGRVKNEEEKREWTNLRRKGSGKKC